MNFSTLFRLGENLNLDRKTLIILRWIAIIGQLTAINLVYFYLELEFPVLIAHVVVFIGLTTNLILQFRKVAIYFLPQNYSILPGNRIYNPINFIIHILMIINGKRFA